VSGDSKARILVIDDEPQIRRLLEISLRAQGYAVSTASDGRTGIDELATRGADLVILDLGLPDMDGSAVLAEIRRWSTVPVLVLSVRSREEEKVRLLDAGANDYLTKPFGMQELAARLRVLLRFKPGDELPLPVFDDGRLHIDVVRRSVSLDGTPVNLSRKEFALLELLLRHQGHVVTQPQILRTVWGPGHADDTHYLRILLRKLRAKLGDSALQPRYIHTEPGVGLRFGD
jgi:two-component system KDP operon response regulator KdpE